MSADPFANTTTVKNILQHVISPKIVKDNDGAGPGYITKVDLVNVDNIVLNPYQSGYPGGTTENRLTSQCGTIRYSEPVVLSNQNGKYYTVYHERVTPNSVIFAVVRSTLDIFVVNVVPGDKEFTIGLSTITGFNGIIVGWFIASF